MATNYVARLCLVAAVLGSCVGCDQFTKRIAREHLKVAINTQFGEWDAPLREGDTVVFLPPVAGG